MTVLEPTVWASSTRLREEFMRQVEGLGDFDADATLEVCFHPRDLQPAAQLFLPRGRCCGDKSPERPDEHVAAMNVRMKCSPKVPVGTFEVSIGAEA